MDVFDLYAKISLDSKNYQTGIKNAKVSMDKFKVNIGDTLKTIAKISAAAVSAGATAAGKIVKDAASQYGEYQQLVGGVDTLFKESSKTIQGYADKAFATAQISANEYMDLVTSFSASLIQSTGKDYQRSADLANKAVIDMADNANKMGTNMESIQNAYQGFAKSNYTMLDNLNKMGAFAA